MTFHFEQGYFVSRLWNTVDYLIGVIAMIYVGIDVASEKHDCCILNPKGKPIHYFTFANSEQGFSLLQQELLHHASPEQIRVGLEATGIYGTNLQSFLRRMGVEATTLNPLLLKNNIKGTTLRKTKTDKEDAIAIATFLWKEGLQPDLPVSYHISELKSLTRSRFSLVQCRTRAKVQAKGVLQVLFPEFKNLFADTFGASARAVLKTYPSAKAIAAADTDKLAELLCNASRGRLGRAKAEQLKNCAAHSIATYSDAQSMILVMHLEQIEFFSAQIAKVESQIKAHLLQINSPIMTIPGIGLVLGATILAEVGDKAELVRPAGAVLCYPVTTAFGNTHLNSFINLLGKPFSEITDEEKEYVSLEKAVSEKTSPMYLWHTAEDTLVPLDGTLKVALALKSCGVPFMLDIFPYGPHGVCLSNKVTECGNPAYVQPFAEVWVDKSLEWMKTF